ncbi:MAG: D-hexose-6-phosphate mutarotase [Actinomyces ruminicola]|uniref:Putative glucose-6-phosphate 1-epimerase n=1 Tax=Actinomyces ruminicola TaxID=332524 RepID=A0A1G9UBL6_9ACTO|nr:D-hexose-6-phosphate mutarotase [Actinomyces ruminicola]MBE6481087.1 D-hexose-6-phosphate mutarotase [Actinomyces ruminicola]SDM57336.1 glucose-6-phosphate 1-epimerase [Actinomyces ruminicola]
MDTDTTRPRLPRTAALTPGRGGQPRLLIDAPAGNAEIYLHGAHLTAWTPRGGRPVIFTSRRAVFDGVAPIRGGVPLCLPWFGAGVSGDRRPAHGWGRVSPWQLRSVEPQPGGAVQALFTLEHDGIAALYSVSVGEELALTLSLRRSADAPTDHPVEAALHTYLAVGDVTAVEVSGLDGVHYLDKVTGRADQVQCGALRITGQTDRVYASGSPVTVSDPAYGRRVRVTGVRARNTVVWNPWSAGAAALADMDGDEFASMLCVESAVVGDSATRLEPGESVSLGTRIAVAPL